MAKKSRERVLFEAEIKSLKEQAEGFRRVGNANLRKADEVEERAALIQELLDQAEKAKAAATATTNGAGEEEAEEDGVDPF